MFKYLVGAPEEHIVAESVLLEACALEKIHNRRLYAGEIDHPALAYQALAVFVKGFYTGDIRYGNASHGEYDVVAVTERGYLFLKLGTGAEVERACDVYHLGEAKLLRVKAVTKLIRVYA